MENEMDITWIKYLMINVFSLSIFLLVFATAYFKLTPSHLPKLNKLRDASIISFFISMLISVIIFSQSYFGTYEFLTIKETISTSLSLVFLSCVVVIYTWIKFNYECIERANYSSPVKSWRWLFEYYSHLGFLLNRLLLRWTIQSNTLGI